ncbi:PRC-barrel domain-containing protein [Chryseobacterium sp. MDT2-18]|uniref:PRC-barrel domain-containing protein n=1 Tax=Chryseobacterium sp. MDT2-18 TaxID=1259136 RepID=UPI00278301DA|nr:PRC-barrel domain-containing protein [Chryseobacterium sp. MDT2-18]MDQ0477854.1 sporulation protein YlmC with PRC-barrel domain [Chryseobacterium sp. MDT2-18]
MQHNIKSLIGFRMEAADGDIGRVEEFYFEETSWLIRYLIIETGNWLLNRKVLIVPQAIKQCDAKAEVFRTNLTTEQIRTSPDVGTDQLVSRQQTVPLYGHYDWEWYGSGFYAGGLEAVMDNDPVIDAQDEKGDLHLRSTEEIKGYQIHTADGDFGHVSDFILDDTTWQIIYLVVDTHKWFGGTKLLIKTSAINEIQWGNAKVMVNIITETIKDCPVFDESEFNHS